MFRRSRARFVHKLLYVYNYPRPERHVPVTVYSAGICLALASVGLPCLIPGALLYVLSLWIDQCPREIPPVCILERVVVSSHPNNVLIRVVELLLSPRLGFPTSLAINNIAATRATRRAS